MVLGLLLTGTPGAGAQQGDAHPETVNVDVTVWRRVADPTQLYVSTRPEGGRWRTLNTPLDMSALSSSGSFHQSNAVRVRVPLEGGGTANVDVTVWRRVADPTQLYVSTRPEGGRWRTLNTRLDMSALSSSGNFHQSNAVRVAVSVSGPLPGVASLKVAGIEPLTSVGETVELSVTARMSDGSSRDIEGAEVEWRSSDPWVASVSEGIVTAAGGGKAVIRAAYQGQTAEVDALVRVSRRSTGTVRVLYAIPADKEFQPEGSETIADIMVDLQSWYRRQLGGLTFSVYEVVPEVCRMSESEDFYARGNAWDKVVEGVQHCAPVQHNHPDFVWVVYVDLSEACDEPHELGAGGAGLTILPDVESGFVPGSYFSCGEGPYYRTSGSWTGGLGHELGHALGLPHPPGCDAGLPTCDRWALISLGYTRYPETYLRADNKEVLIRSPFVGIEPVPERHPDDAANASAVRGVAYGPGGQPVQGVRVSLVGDDFWNWGETGGDGAFAIPAPEGSSGSAVLSVHAGEAGDCGWLGYHGTDGITTARAQASRVQIGGGDVSGIEVRLPAGRGDLCPGQRKVTGVVLGPDSTPVEGVWLGAWLGAASAWVRSGVDGTFEFSFPEGPLGSSTLSIHADEVPDFPDCGVVGFYGTGGFTPWRDEALLEIGGFGAPGIEIRLPASPDALCQGQSVVAGTVVGPDGEPVEGFRIGLVHAEPRGFWPFAGGATGRDGTFEIRLLAGQSGSFVVRIYADEEGISTICNQLGYYGSSGFTTTGDDATSIDVSGPDVTGIEIRLPASTDQLLPERVGAYYCGG
ncbi:MAG: hypothetical protein OXH07_07130 [Chloroflexi bacterium]|nr:hypothetical protein [Chloroflexota bacterium]